MKEVQYRQALAFAWAHTWRNKFLWIYGLFAAMLGQFGFGDVLVKIWRSAAHADMFGVRTMSSYRGMWRGMHWSQVSLSGDGWAWMLWLIVWCGGFIALMVIMAVISQGALIHAAAEGAEGRKVRPSSSVAWRTGVDHMWRLLPIAIGRKVVFAFLALVVGASAYVTLVQPTTGNTFIFLAVFLISIMVGLVTAFFTLYAAAYVVVEEFSVGRALAAAWRLFLDHWLVSLEIGLIFFAINVFVIFFVVAAFFALLLPMVVLWFFAIATVNQALFTVVVFLFFTAFILFIAILGSAFTVFATSVWVYLFQKMHRHGIRSRLMHWMAPRVR